LQKVTGSQRSRFLGGLIVSASGVQRDIRGGQSLRIGRNLGKRGLDVGGDVSLLLKECVPVRQDVCFGLADDCAARSAIEKRIRCRDLKCSVVKTIRDKLKVIGQIDADADSCVSLGTAPVQ